MGSRLKIIEICCLFTLLLSICGCAAFTQGVNSTVKDMEIDQAPIHAVHVNIAESYPPQVILWIKGGLKDSCTSVYEIKEKRIGNEIVVEITTQRPKGASCDTVYSFFERYVNIGTEFISGQTYTIKVNEYVTTFTMQ